jgi:hypothetical protein
MAKGEGAVALPQPPSSRTSEQSERDPGPITTGRCCCEERRPIVLNKNGRWLWVPAFAGTTRGERASLRHKSGWLFSRDQSAVLFRDTDGEVVAVDVQCDVQVAGMKMRLGGICEIRDLRSCEDDVSRP